jgi:hypothetical protein
MIKSSTAPADCRWLRCRKCQGLTSRAAAEATAQGRHACAGCGHDADLVDLRTEIAERRRQTGCQV